MLAQEEEESKKKSQVHHKNYWIRRKFDAGFLCVNEMKFSIFERSKSINFPTVNVWLRAEGFIDTEIEPKLR